MLKISAVVDLLPVDSLLELVSLEMADILKICWVNVVQLLLLMLSFIVTLT